jgi:hypothetical protein
MFLNLDVTKINADRKCVNQKVRELVKLASELDNYWVNFQRAIPKIQPFFLYLLLKVLKKDGLS